MKKILLILALFITSISVAQKINPLWCTVGNSNPDIEYLTNKSSINKILTNSRLIDPNGVIIIPVVFHVLYDPNKPDQNIPQAVITSQLERLNTDMRKLNTDISLLPAVWQPLAADLKFEFRLACIDPNGLTTNGVIRKAIPVGYEFCDFNFSGQPPKLCGDVKLSAANGDDAWPTDTYLNIWVCDMANSGLSGLSSFPWDRFGPDVIFTIGTNSVSVPRTALDGIVLDYKVVGNPSQSPAHNIGRVLTHEVGHWLGLYHTYQRGPNQTNPDPPCSLPGDFVDDTPPQLVPTFVCGIFPLNDFCSPAPGDGIMFMNYMDVTPDECMYFFTTGQKDRARSYFSETGPTGTRFPYIQNYFGIKHFTINPHIVQNNLITVPFNNPACLPVIFSYTGPVSVFRQDDQRVIFNVACGVSGTVSVTITSGNYTDDYVFDFENPPCPWPKIYQWSGVPPEVMSNTNISKGVNNNLYYTLSSTNILNNINHTGQLPANTNSNFLLEYNSAGITSWAKSNLTATSDIFVLNNGKVRTKISNISTQYIYLDGLTGTQTTGPVYLPDDEKILAETSLGNFISYKSGQIFVHTPTVTTSVTLDVTNSFFNQTSNKLFIEGNSQNIMVYNLVGDNLIFDLTFNAGYNNHLYHVDNQNNIYLLHLIDGGQPMYKYDYSSSSVIPLVMPGFVNGSINALRSGPYLSVNYSSDKCMVSNGSVSMLQVLDFATNTVKGINATGYCFYPSFAAAPFYTGCSYGINGDNIYISGWVFYPSYANTVTIGNQTIQNITPGGASHFITKLSLGDFSFGFTEQKSETKKETDLATKSFTVYVSPNPASDVLTISIKNTQAEKSLNSLYKVIITDRAGNVVNQKISSTLNIKQPISNLMPGSYFLTITNEKGEAVTQSFIKL